MREFLTAGNRRNGTSKVGPFNRATPAHRAHQGLGEQEGRELGFPGGHESPRGKTARFRAGKVVPAAAVAATLAVGAAAFILIGGGGQPQASQLNAALGVQSAGASGAGIGHANGTASAMVRASLAPASPASKHTAKPSAKPSAKPAAPSTPTPTASAPRQAPASRAASAPAATKAASSPVAAASTSAKAPATLSCNLSGGMLPANVSAIVSFLLAHGYSNNAAAGIAGNIYQESKGNPESVGMGGGGLIGWTPLHPGMVTGNVAADLQTQLDALLTYNQVWASYIPALNAASSPASAADIYVTDFERAGIPAASTREAAAQDVAAACGI